MVKQKDKNSGFQRNLPPRMRGEKYSEYSRRKCVESDNNNKVDTQQGIQSSIPTHMRGGEYSDDSRSTENYNKNTAGTQRDIHSSIPLYMRGGEYSDHSRNVENYNKNTAGTQPDIQSSIPPHMRGDPYSEYLRFIENLNYNKSTAESSIPPHMRDREYSEHLSIENKNTAGTQRDIQSRIPLYLRGRKDSDCSRSIENYNKNTAGTQRGIQNSISTRMCDRLYFNTPSRNFTENEKVLYPYLLIAGNTHYYPTPRALCVATPHEWGLQSHRAASDLRQQVSAALERQLSSYAAAAFNIPVQSQTSSTSALNNLSSLAAVKPPLKQHAPLTSSNSVANCSASHIKSASASSKEHRKLDRSVSEPADRSQSNLRAAPPNSSRYKTELCRPFEESGACKYGDKCQFAHGAHELRNLTRHPKYKTELCRTFHTTGLCPYGPRCHFIHNSEDVKKSLLTTLQTGSSPPSASPPKRLSPPPTVPNLDFSSFSLGSAGELSPPMSSTSSGSPTSAAGGFLFDDLPFGGVSQVPQSAPPAVTSGFFYGQDFTPLSSLSSLVPPSDYYTPPHQQGFEATEDSMINILASELDNMSCLDRGDGPKADSATSKTEQNLSVDVNRNLRLPIFSKLAHGSCSSQ